MSLRSRRKSSWTRSQERGADGSDLPGREVRRRLLPNHGARSSHAWVPPPQPWGSGLGSVIVTVTRVVRTQSAPHATVHLTCVDVTNVVFHVENVVFDV